MDSIVVGEIKPGMVIAEDIYDRNGRFLLGKGVVLSEKHLRVLKIWGITEAKIEGVSENEANQAAVAELDPVVLQKAARLVACKFRHTNKDHEAIRELYRVCVLRLARRAAEGELVLDELEETLSGSGALGDESRDHRECPFSNRERSISPRDLLRKDMKLPSLPSIFFQINDAINDPRSSAKDIANIIKNDTSLSAKLLKLANSPIYRFSSRVETVSRAVTLIGTKEIGVLALGITIMTCFKGIPDDMVNMKMFWEHSVACGVASRIMGGFKRVYNVERLFTAGLLHDLGRLVVFKCLPDDASEALLWARFDNSFLLDKEREVFGVSHASMGGRFLKEWRLPVSIENIVRFHHKPMKSHDPMEPAIVHVADLLINAMGVGTSGEVLVHPLDAEAWECLDLPKSIFATMIKQIDRQIGEITRVFADG